MNFLASNISLGGKELILGKSPGDNEVTAEISKHSGEAGTVFYQGFAPKPKKKNNDHRTE